jgi:Flp pilus assembly pilin Flp
MGILLRLWSDDRGQDLAEYGIALAVIGTVAATVAVMIATNVDNLWAAAGKTLRQAVRGHG